MDKHELNRISQRKWYERQKSVYGVVYEIKNTKTGESYIGFTKNSLKKVLRQYTSKARQKTRQGEIRLLFDNIREFGRNVFVIDELYKLTADDDPDIMKGKWIRQFRPLLNKQEEQDELIDKVECGIPRRYWTPEEEAAALAELTPYDRKLLKGSINDL